MSHNTKAQIRLKFVNQKQIDTLFRVLAPEAKSSPTHRCNVKIEKIGSFIDLTVEAEDTVALRATLNAYLRWINSTTRILSVLEKMC